MLRKFLLQASIRRNFTASSSSFVFLRQCSSSSSSSSQIPNGHFVEHLENSAESPPSATISIDRTALYNPPGIRKIYLYDSVYFFPFYVYCEGWICLYVEHSHEPSAESELVKNLKNIIKVVDFLGILFSLFFCF